jgi:hypothetical protein
VLTLPSVSVSSPLRVFSQETARRNAARAITLIAQRRSEREEMERYLDGLQLPRQRGTAG